jgi:hypothetical protein
MIEESGTRLTRADGPRCTPTLLVLRPTVVSRKRRSGPASSGGVWMALRPPAVTVTPRPGTDAGDPDHASDLDIVHRPGRR